MNRKLQITCSIVSAAFLALGATANAQLLYSSGHGDVGIAYEDGELVPHWHIDTGILPETEYDPGEVRAVVGAQRSSPSGSESVLGVTSGSSIYVAGTSATQPNLGFGSEELDPADWQSLSAFGQINIELTAFSGPGTSPSTPRQVAARGLGTFSFRPLIPAARWEASMGRTALKSSRAITSTSPLGSPRRVTTKSR